MLLCVNYHYLRPSFPAQGIHGETPEQFRDQLERLAKIGTFVSGEGVSNAAQGLWDGMPKRAILVTFDDGLREQYEYAWPILQAMGIPALFFVNTQPIQERIVLDVHKMHQIIAHGLTPRFVSPSPEATAKYPYDTPEMAAVKYHVNVTLTPSERTRKLHGLYTFVGDEAAESRALYMTHAQLENLAIHDCLGTHGHDHEVSPHGFRGSQYLLEAWTRHTVRALSYPFGHRAACDATVVGTRFDLGFTMERGVNHDLSRPLLLGRISCADLPDAGPLDALWDLPRCVWA